MSLGTYFTTKWRERKHAAPLALEVATEDAPPFIAAGAVVRLANGKLGTVESCGLSPYWREECDGVQRAYVVSLPGAPAWSDYALASEIVAVLA